MCVIFSPKFEGFFEAELKLVFYDARRSSLFVVCRRLQGIAGSTKDHNLFESLDQENENGRPIHYVPPQTVIPLMQPDGHRRSRNLPEYDVHQIIKEAVNTSTTVNSYDEKARGLISALQPKSLTEHTYVEYFWALLNIEDGQQQCVPLCLDFRQSV